MWYLSKAHGHLMLTSPVFNPTEPAQCTQCRRARQSGLNSFSATACQKLRTLLANLSCQSPQFPFVTHPDVHCNAFCVGASDTAFQMHKGYLSQLQVRVDYWTDASLICCPIVSLTCQPGVVSCHLVFCCHLSSCHTNGNSQAMHVVSAAWLASTSS